MFVIFLPHIGDMGNSVFQKYCYGVWEPIARQASQFLELVFSGSSYIFYDNRIIFRVQVFVIYSARKAGDLARKTAKTKLMRLAQVRAKTILGKCRF